MEARSSFGGWLRARRRALDLTQFQLAERAGCAEDTLGRIEAGTRRPSKQVAVLLAEALHVPAQSHSDFIRFAREGTGFSSGGSVATLERIQDVGDTSAAPGTTQLAAPVSGVSSRAPSAMWVPYLSTVPQPLTPLIGREVEVEAGAKLLSSRQARLLTLTGPPGVGKTRLSLALASALTPAFPDGICYVPLALLRDPSLLSITVAHSLGLVDNGGEGLHAEYLLDFLRQKRLLLVLDNFEHILAATPQLATWLSASTHLQVLVTSRSALHLRGERLFPVSTLPVPPIAPNTPPEGGDLTLPADLEAYPSVALFVERVQEVDPVFRLTKSNWWAVAELCRRMEGLPLAIELTATRSAHLSPELVLARLEQRLDVAKSGPRDLPYHQRTLRAAIGWSYDLLDEPERLLFERMSVFVGGATFDALEAICNARGDIEGGLAGALEGLLQQSLVYRVSVTEEAEDRRFNMLEMLREYAVEMLALRDNESQLQERRETEVVTLGRYHAEYFLVLAEEAEKKLRSDEQAKWLDFLEAERANISAAIQWYARIGDYERGLRIAAAIWRFWWLRGPVREGQAYLQRLLADAPRQGDSEVPPRVVGRALSGYTYLLTLSGNYEQGIAYGQQAVDVFRSIGDEWGLAEALSALGLSKFYVDDVEGALECLTESVAIRRKLGDNHGLARSLANLGEVMRYHGRYDEAKELYTETLGISLRDAKDDWGAGVAYHNLAQVAIHQEDYERAAELVEEGFTLRGTRDTKQSGALYLALLGRLLLEIGGEPDTETLRASARLLAACTSLLDSISITIERIDLLSYDHALEIVRAGLSEKDFEDASEEGRSLAYEQALDLGDRAIRVLREKRPAP